MRNAFLKSLTELAGDDSNIMLLTGDLGFGVFEEFAKLFPKQYLNVGVAEQNMTGVATGLALEGRSVFTYSIGNFPTLRCLEQIRNGACYHSANITIVCTGGGFSYGALGMSHHATEDLPIMRALPNTTVVAPGDNWEAFYATKQLAKMESVGYIRIDKTSAGDTSFVDEVYVIGKARRIKEGSDVAIICLGGILSEALKAAKILEKKNIQSRVVSMHTLKPIDVEEVLSAIKETGGLVTVEEGNLNGGLASAVAEICLENHILPGFFSKIGLNNIYSSIVGSQDYLRKHYKMDAEAIVNCITNSVTIK